MKLIINGVICFNVFFFFFTKLFEFNVSIIVFSAFSLSAIFSYWCIEFKIELIFLEVDVNVLNDGDMFKGTIWFSFLFELLLKELFGESEMVLKFVFSSLSLLLLIVDMIFLFFLLLELFVDFFIRGTNFISGVLSQLVLLQYNKFLWV